MSKWGNIMSSLRHKISPPKEEDFEAELPIGVSWKSDELRQLYLLNMSNEKKLNWMMSQIVETQNLAVDTADAVDDLKATPMKVTLYFISLLAFAFAAVVAERCGFPRPEKPEKAHVEHIEPAKTEARR